MESQDNGNRNTEIVRLSEAGMTHTAIGERFGITRQRVSAIVAKQAGQGNARERELRKLYDRQAKRADNPPVKSTATGQTQLNPLTCTCGSKADRLRDHKPGCEVQPVFDTRVGLDADKERRMLLKEMRAESEQHQVLSDAEEQRQVAEVISFMNQVLQRNDHLERLLRKYESEADAGVIDAEIVPDLPPDAVPALVSLRDQFSAQLPRRT